MQVDPLTSPLTVCANRLTLAVLVGITFCTLPLSSHAGTREDNTGWTPRPYQATYTAEYNGMSVVAERSLTVDNSAYRIASSVKGLLGGMTETEDFHLDDSNRIRSDRYTAEKSFFGAKRREQQDIDHSTGIGVYQSKKKHREVSVAPDDLGPVTYQLQLRRHLQYQALPVELQVLRRGRVKTYRFELLGEESIDTGLGRVDTVKVQRVRENSDRHTVFWLAPEWDYLIVKLAQREDDGEAYEMVLESAAIEGRDLVPPSR